MEPAHERDHARPARRLARQLEGRLDRVRPGRPAELHAVVERGGPEHALLERFEKLALGGREEIEPVQDPAIAEVLRDPLDDVGVVVPVVERSRTGQKVHVRGAVPVEQERALRAIELYRAETRVRADCGLPPLEDLGAPVSLHLGFQ